MAFSTDEPIICHNEFNIHGGCLNPTNIFAFVNNFSFVIFRFCNFPNNYVFLQINRHNKFIGMELDFFNFIFVPLKSTNHLVFKFRCIFIIYTSFRMRSSHIPDSGSEVLVFVAARHNPVSIWSPCNTPYCFILANHVRQLDFVVSRKRVCSRCLFLLLSQCPNQKMSIFTDSREFISFWIEFAKPYLLFVSSQRCQASCWQ